MKALEQRAEQDSGYQTPVKTTPVKTIVSFGNKETLIIDELPPDKPVKQDESAEERSSVQQPKEVKIVTGLISAPTTKTNEPRVTFGAKSPSSGTSSVPKAVPVTILVTDANQTSTTNIVPGVPRPLRRSPSTESRDNPFIPDGELSKETDELLKRATIIRDKFYLDQKEKDEKERREREVAAIDSSENLEKSPVQESIVSPVSSQPAQASAKGSQPARAEVKPRMRENGKVEDTVSPEAIKPEVDKGEMAPNADGSKTSPDAPDGVNDKEKKKQKKCCSIM